MKRAYALYVENSPEAETMNCVGTIALLQDANGSVDTATDREKYRYGFIFRSGYSRKKFVALCDSVGADYHEETIELPDESSLTHGVSATA